MAQVQHGRRRGQSKGMPEMPQMPMGMQLPDGSDLRQVAVLNKSDWDRISQQLNRRQIEEDRINRIHDEKENLKNQSKELVKNWGNTIAGQRQRKLEARKIREEKEEEEKKLIDIDEAKYQAGKRKEAIEKAKTQQYYQTDRVKGFHGALLLTEVLKERDAQVELKSLRANAASNRDKVWAEKAREEYEDGVKVDQQKAKERKNLHTKTASFQQRQMKEHKREEMAEQEENVAEGQELKVLASSYEEEKERLENIRRNERRQMMVDNVAQIHDVDKMKAIKEQQDEEENEECRIFAAAKRKMMKLRAGKEMKLHEEKQTHLEKIREKLAAQMQQKCDNEDERIRRAVEEKETIRAEEDTVKEEKTTRLIQEAADHRVKQMKEAEMKKKIEYREELELLKIRQDADAIFHQNEAEKTVKKKHVLKKHANAQRNQAKENVRHKRVEQEEQLELDKKNIELLTVEEEQFQEYANKVIDHCVKGKRNVYPLVKAAQGGAGGGSGPRFDGKGGIRPSYMATDETGKQMPCYQRESTEATKKLIYGKAPSKKRLGFVW